MHRCALHAENELTAQEVALNDPMDRALAAASYIRKRLNDTAAANEYAHVLQQPLAVEQSAYDYS